MVLPYFILNTTSIPEEDSSIVFYNHFFFLLEDSEFFCWKKIDTILKKWLDDVRGFELLIVSGLCCCTFCFIMCFFCLLQV